MNSFIEPRLKDDYAHYVVRRSILAALEGYFKEFRGTVVDLGCGDMPYKGIITALPGVDRYISIDWPGTRYYRQQPDLQWDGYTIPLADESADVVLFTEVAEHIDDPAVVFREIHRVLRQGGFVAGTTPFFWLLHEVPNDMRRLTPFSLKKLFEESGFSSHEITGAGGWNTSLAQFLGMYIEFGVKRRFIRHLLRKLAYFPILYLAKHDEKVTEFKHTQMINSISFKATR